MTLQRKKTKNNGVLIFFCLDWKNANHTVHLREGCAPQCAENSSVADEIAVESVNDNPAPITFYGVMMDIYLLASRYSCICVAVEVTNNLVSCAYDV